MIGNYAPRVPVHPQRYGATKTKGANRLLVLHTSEGPELPTSAEALAAYFALPGDRPNGSGGMYGSSYHAVFDTDQIIPAVPDDVVAFAAAGANHDGVHGVFPGKASQTREQWLDANTRPMIRQAAALAIDKSQEHGIPLRRVSPAQIVAGEAGVCDHHDVTLAYGKSTHVDLGENFPWDVFWDDVNSLLAPTPQPPEEPVAAPVKTVLIDVRPPNAVWLCDGNSKTWVKHGDAWTQIQMRINESAGRAVNLAVEDVDGIQPAWDGFVYNVRRHGGNDVIASFGPVVGPVPAGFDAYGRKS